MKTLERVIRQLGSAVSFRAIVALLAAVMIMLHPSMALAAGGENVILRFQDSDKIYLWISLGFGIIALLYGLIYLRNYVMAQSPGSEKMQAVGLAIKDGAMAYLKQQIRTMGIFVVILAVGIFLLFQKFGTLTSGLMALCFIGGVAASYIAGFAGMVMAVNGNMRVANAALKSYKASLEIAFRSGAVAGMVTVGMGLLGATLILLFAGEIATKLLVGFGFGGSLAALFMRVGGGIFTKAADVGADLVGKVEAGIPEDDPRNPATIADNVGDNVGDCAGMAADVFESYEVTLVAAIVLGAATAAIFDTETWTRLILFALMARGIGIIASMIGIQSVKGDDDVDTDPLKPIRRGFYSSAAIAGVLTIALAWFMMGGKGNPIITTQLSPVAQMQREEADKLDKIKRDLVAIANSAETKTKAEAAVAKLASDLKRDAATLSPADFVTAEGTLKTELQGIPQAALARAISKSTEPIRVWELTPRDVLFSEGAKALGYTDKDEQAISQTMAMDITRPDTTPSLAGLMAVKDPNDLKANPVLGFATTAAPQTTPGATFRQYEAIGTKFAGTGDDQYIAAKVESKGTIPARPAAGNMPATPERKIDQTFWIGPVKKSAITKQIDEAMKGAKEQNIQATIKLVEEVPFRLYTGPNGRVALAIDEGKVPRPWTLSPSEQLVFFESPAEEMNKLTPGAGSPPPQQIALAVARHQTVAWWLFAAAILFGLAMAFAIETLTDYYVSTHKKPVQEVAGVSTAGAAPMIIQGFAYALESSVFMVFSIVIALLFPLFLFSPELYGGYILSFYGIALVGLGLLTTTGYVLAMDTFGPISDNAQGVFEMSGEAHDNVYASKAVQRLDAAGNTTKALTKGFAIATAVVAAVALFHSYLEDARLAEVGLRVDVPEIFLGLLIGGAAPYLFSAFAINAVGRSSFELINEVRRQFRNDPGIMLGTSKPDYGRCVAIVTAAAQRELLGPGILAIALPVAVAFGFAIGKPLTEINGQMYNLTGAQALGGFLVGTILSGQLMAVLLANAGGMWDNSKKLIEDGMYGGKGTDAHKAAVVCDTVGDPFKDTAGPALNPLIKVMNLVALLLAPVVIMPHSTAVLIIVTLVAVAALAAAIYVSKKGSMSESMTAATNEAAANAAIAASDPSVGSETTAPKKTLTIEDLKKGDKEE